jgi:hypothetical protein
MLLIVLSLFLFFILFPNELFLYSDTILGKLMAVIIIIYCTYENIIYGIFACIVIIWFYQSDMLAQFNNRYSEYFSPQVVYLPDKPNKDLQHLPALEELPLEKVYLQELPPLKKESEKVFRNQHCSEELNVMYNNSKIIHKENVKHFFPEISFLDEIPCNPCNKSCRFRLDKVTKECELTPKSARGNDTNIWEWATSWLPIKLEPYQGIGHVASFLP